MRKKFSQWICASLAVSSVALSGCTMHKPDGTPTPDPFEKYNRAMFAFNMDVDHLVVRPAAKVYEKITPTPLKKGVQNVFANVDEMSTLPNDFMQGNFRYMVLDIWRFAINTTLGVGGLFDVATRMGIRPHVETFGLTLAKWRGGQSSPYIVLPFLGPSTLQNGIGNAADFYMTFWPYLKDQNITYAGQGVRLLDMRAQLLPGDKLVETAFDPYIFVRDAYMQTQDEKIAKNQQLSKIPQKLEKDDVSTK